MDAEYVVVSTTLEAREAAEAMAQEMVQRRLAACVQLWPITSFYRWEGEIERAEEVLLIAKTTAERAEEILSFIAQHHPYELPEILVTPVLSGHAPYLRWLEQETGTGARCE
jgi:periplasmic divalent cation tolerance protein